MALSALDYELEERSENETVWNELQLIPKVHEDHIEDVISDIMDNIFDKIFPEKKRELTFEKASNCLSVLGKIWNLSEYPPTNFQGDGEISLDSKEKLMDMEGYIDDYQYLHIEAVDLALTDVRVIPKNFVWLVSVDLSGNQLTNSGACPVTKLKNLVALKLNRNRIKDPYLPPVKHLQYLGLSHNKISSLSRIYHPNLETLVLNYNPISKVEAKDAWKLSRLLQLELRGCRLKSVSGIEYEKLKNLYLAENQIEDLTGISELVNLERLHLRANLLTDLTGFTEKNSNLKYLNLRNCLIPNVEKINALEVLKGLKELIVTENPFNYITSDKGDLEEKPDAEDKGEFLSEESVLRERIRMQILRFLPQLTRLDKTPVTKYEIDKMYRSLEDKVGDDE